MSPEPTYLQVRRQALLDVSQVCTTAATDMASAGQAYATADAKDTPGCFGLVTGASDELYKEYEEFYVAMQKAVTVLHQTLDQASKNFVVSHTTYEYAEWSNLLDTH